jgi:acetyltransferase-like isoleucine patch superfamily enzyme
MSNHATAPVARRSLADRLRGKDCHDVINHLSALRARWVTRLWYARFFDAIGAGSWIKPLAQLYGPGRITLGAGVRLEKDCILYSVKRSGAAAYEGWIRLGDRAFMNVRCNLTAAFGIDIGADVAFGPNVFVCDFDHGYEQSGESRLSTPLRSKGPIVLGDRCWVGANSCISSGVTLGHDCVVGANSVVTRSFPPHTVIAGAPARAIRRLDPGTGVWQRIDDASST